MDEITLGPVTFRAILAEQSFTTSLAADLGWDGAQSLRVTFCERVFYVLIVLAMLK